MVGASPGVDAATQVEVVTQGAGPQALDQAVVACLEGEVVVQVRGRGAGASCGEPPGLGVASLVDLGAAGVCMGGESAQIRGL